MAGSESTRNADRIASAFERAEINTIVCDYWKGESFDPMRLARKQASSLISVTDLGFQSLIRLSSAQYSHAFGDDIDFITVNAQTFSNQHYPRQYVLTKELLNIESPYYQRLRGFAAKIDHLLSAIRPDLAVIQQGSEVLSRLIFAKVLKYKIPWLCSETPFFHGHLLLDSAGQHFFPGKNEVDIEWKQISKRELSYKEIQRLERFVAEWKKNKSSKYAQPETSSEEHRIKFFMEDSNGPILFVPMQVPVDANVHHGLGKFESLADFYRKLLKCLPDNWRIIFKKHPIDSTDSHKAIEETPQVLVVLDANIHELIQSSTAVAVFSSNVGLEALIYGKPVIVGGNPCYSGKGLTIDPPSADGLHASLEKSLQWHPDAELCRRFIRYIIEDYLIAEFDKTALLKRIDKAIRGVSRKITNSTAPFSEMEPKRARNVIEFVHAYKKLEWQNYTHKEIIAQLPLPEFIQFEDMDVLRNGERQVKAWLSKIDSRHKSRYALLSTIMRQNCNVLDIACGVGYGAYMMADKTGAHVDAVDISYATISYAKSNWAHANISYIAASADTYLSGIIKNKYDIIVSFDTLGNIHNPHLFLEQLWRCLRPGGVLFLSTSNSDIYPLIENYCHMGDYNQSLLDIIIRQLPNLAGHTIYWQEDLLIDDHPTSKSRFLIAVISKNTQETNDVEPLVDIHKIIPFYYQPSTHDISSMSDFFKTLLRRKIWLKNILFKNRNKHSLL